MTENKPFSKSPRTLQTLYRNQSDLKRVLEIVVEALKKAQDGEDSPLMVDEEGFCRIDDTVSFLKGIEGLDYINYSHIIELFFKDPDRKILINGDDRIKFKSVRYVKPPEVLYFGTIENLKGRMLESGIRSRTKGYIKLYATESQAIAFATKFATSSDDKIITLEIDSEKAFSDGLKFSTYIDGEFIVVLVDKKYLMNNKGASNEKL